ncbi:phosphopantothenoylcysteine decarboxylase [Hyphobacterium sp. HN65]|uniref:Phosphopantothenoylcysteine decarboxylase n=1 Tax=Hyphobacterium lacteum TaxID=3116575 RepID=A0ABU7LS29_9PROT|nr:phosphopantothenoylcysteine decarboxylase [Hyphobacterium sp. HN65]MEE2526721.1 phosphopantothenoylcysteine decarboxylase [Hyphobacterium sp. HN65]
MSALQGKSIVVTAGPTIEPIDPVRFLSNRSSGKQGYLIAEALAAGGANVRLISGPTCLPCPNGVERIDVETALDMLAAVETALPADAFIAVAAVADWRPASKQARKAEKAAQGASLDLVENPDILATIAQRENDRPALVIGFAAETHDMLDRARAKRLRKGCDWIIANDVSGDVMGGDENAAWLIGQTHETEWKRAPKKTIAENLAAAMDAHFSSR